MSLGGQSSDAISGDFEPDPVGSAASFFADHYYGNPGVREDWWTGATGPTYSIPMITPRPSSRLMPAELPAEITSQARRDAAREAGLLARINQAASLRDLQQNQISEAIAREAAVENAAAIRRGIQPVISGLSFLSPNAFYDEEGEVDPLGTAFLNVPALGNLMRAIDYVGTNNWSTESPFGPYDVEQFSSATSMPDFSFPGDLPGGGFDPTHGEGGDPYGNIVTPVAPPTPEPEPETPPAPETPTYDPSLWYRPTLLDQSPSLPNFAALNDAFTRSYALRPGIYTDQPNLLGYTQYG
jgi:hypothetical protein